MPMRIEQPFPLDYVAGRLSALTTGRESEPRAVGWHISSLNKASRELAKGKPIDPDYYYCSEDSSDMRGLEDEIPPGILDWGNIWEAAVRPALSDWCKYMMGQPASGPAQVIIEGDMVANADGLVHSADGNSVIAILECKFRFSPGIDPLQSDDWIRQTKAYCHVWGTNLVIFANGYVRNSPPGGGSGIYMIYYEPAEIAENWQMLVNTRDYLEKLRLEKLHGNPGIH